MMAVALVISRATKNTMIRSTNTDTSNSANVKPLERPRCFRVKPPAGGLAVALANEFLFIC
jgi:hypothetical protein